MIDNAQAELDDILLEYRGRILTYDELYRKQHHSSHRRIVDFEHANTVMKQALLDWHNKQIEEVLDRLEQSGVPSPTTPAGDIEFVPMSEVSSIENEISGCNKLKESK